ncbi:RSP_2647 family RNA methyltransferase [Jannaschia aquimarina]|uniref:RlmI protein n=1 Tax=Jannaschia aquimarina TaxID=935700 RepID=A0A0D1EEW0_9RHOB|nr:class I SAM-dependent rRNA methyltransferase [Jannaschia aquimarina]KIT14425.1 Ribosomal RNA large subunit methyltransferase I [Jannaschia aquimarina]SNT29551.1 23S rRNA (cytosine1962-C5)-methyltransferase [Jannaschia aquimarina]
MTDRPIVRLRPKADARRIRWGFPWIRSDELVLDRRTKALPAGSIVDLEDAERTPLATVALTPASRLPARVLDAPGTEIDADWISARLARAAVMRDRLYDRPFYRLAHAEADGLPGVIVDRFGDTAVIQPNAAWAEVRIDDFVTALRDLGIDRIVKSASGRARAAEGLDDVSETLVGEMDGPIPVEMNGATYFADLTGGQKTGLFYDQRPNHAFVARLSRGARVLDVFSHVGGFALAALAGGAQSAVAVDGSAAALDLARRGAEVGGVSDRFETRRSDAFDAMADLAGETFDVVIADPPAFAPSKSALTNGLRAYERVARLAAALVAPGGYLTLCSCSHAAGLEKFRAASIRGIGRAGRGAQILRTGGAGPDHPIHPQLGESGYLKALTFRLF